MYRGERLNATTHLVGLLLAVPAAAWLVDQAARTGSGWRVATAAVFGIALIVLFAASTLCHSSRGLRQRLWERLDHGAIFLLIAATMTPFAALTGDGWLRWAALGGVWLVGLWGMYRALWGASDAPMLKHYLVLGWVATLACIPGLQELPARCIQFFAVGAVVYTAGTYFFVNAGTRRHAHGIWHLFVLAGSAFHFGAVAECVLG